MRRIDFELTCCSRESAIWYIHNCQRDEKKKKKRAKQYKTVIDGRCILPEANNAIKMSLVPRDRYLSNAQPESTITFAIVTIGRLNLAVCSLVLYICTEMCYSFLIAPVKTGTSHPNHVSLMRVQARFPNVRDGFWEARRSPKRMMLLHVHPSAHGRHRARLVISRNPASRMNDRRLF